MTTYRVTKKSDNSLAYTYSADAPIEWDDFPFSDFNHTAEVIVVEPTPNISVFGGRRKLTHLEFRSLMTKSEQENIDEFEATFESNVNIPNGIKKTIRTTMKKYNEATLIDLDEPDIKLGLEMYVSLGAMLPERVAEVLNG